MKEINNQNIMKDKFKRFLIEHGIYNRFEMYLETLRELSLPNLNEYLDIANPSDFISSGFMWDKTEEGNIFWDTLDNKWIVIITEPDS